MSADFVYYGKIMETLQGIYIHRAMLFLIACSLALGTSLAEASSQPIYNDNANARQVIAAAISEASKTGKNVVLIFGANW